MKKFTFNLGILVLMLMVLTLYVFAATPEGPTDINMRNTTRRTVQSTSNLSAIAGNVTEINITTTTVTQAWAGFYGNVTGVISLENSGGEKMYDWAIANPQGEVYATEAIGTPLWGSAAQTGNISCWNYTKGVNGETDEKYPYYGEIEGWDTAVSGTEVSWMKETKGIKSNAADSINNTFLRTSARSFPSFYVGNQFINGTLNKDQCPSIALYNSTGSINGQRQGSHYGGAGHLDPSAATGAATGGKYQEVILIDATNMYLLYTAIVDYEHNEQGFDGNIWDFQMIVPENGHGSDTAVTEYNFYIELE